MDENHQDKAGSKLVANETKLWLPPIFINNKAPLASTPKKRGINWGFADKSFWEWILFLGTLLAALGAIAIPFVVTMLGFYLTQQVTQQQAQLSASQHQTDLQIAVDQQRETILKTCLDDIKDLLLNKSLRASKPEDEVRVVARVEVLTALRQLDGGRKGLLMRFLSEAGLITGSSVGLHSREPSRNNVIINLRGANLRGADLHVVDLRGANLRSADLHDADLRAADLRGAILLFANLSGANLWYANLNSADLIGADLIGAILSIANLRDADLGAANLHDANLLFANLRGADLSDADLIGANVIQAQLNEAKSLQGTVMPNGSKHP